MDLHGKSLCIALRSCFLLGSMTACTDPCMSAQPLNPPLPPPRPPALALPPAPWVPSLPCPGLLPSPCPCPACHARNKVVYFDLWKCFF